MSKDDKIRCDRASLADLLATPDDVLAASGPEAHATPMLEWGGKDGLHAEATTGRAEARAGVVGAYVEGPSANAEAGGSFVGVEASLMKVGVRAGPLLAEFNPNLNIGVSMNDGGSFGFSFLWFGFSFGPDSHVATPLGKIGFKF